MGVIFFKNIYSSHDRGAYHLRTQTCSMSLIDSEGGGWWGGGGRGTVHHWKLTTTKNGNLVEKHSVGGGGSRDEGARGRGNSISP